MKKRKDGRYAISRTINGKRLFFYSTKSARDAINNYQIYLTSLKDKKEYSSNMLFKDWVDTWLNIKATQVEESTLASYKQVINLRLLPLWSDFSLSTINLIDVRQKLTDMLNSGLSARSVNYARTILLAIIKQAVADELLSRNPLEQLKKFKEHKKEKVIISGVQLQKLLSIIDNNEQLKRMLIFGVNTGLRREELLGLSWDNVDYMRSTISVNKTVLDIDHKTILSNTTKNATSVRTIQISDRMIQILKMQHKYILHCKLVNSGYTDSNLIFQNKYGRAMSPNNFSRAVVAYGKKAGLPDGFSYYSLRHTHATLLIEAGASIKAVQERMGHKSFTTTAGYLHVTPQAAKDCADKIEKALNY